uniref:Uncharacterized protein n=1 Tax=Ovis aries TaxID=9940 RepID=A0AC11BSX1_SHEEP
EVLPLGSASADSASAVWSPAEGTPSVHPSKPSLGLLVPVPRSPFRPASWPPICADLHRSPFLLFSCLFLHSGHRIAMSNNMAKIAEARKTVEQLKLEVNIDRMKVSQAAAELLAFCETHAKDDPLVTPVPAAENPFRDKRLFCVLL